MATLYIAHDPMCSWCWGFRPTQDRLLAGLPEDVRVIRLLGGLAPDCDQAMPEETRRYVQNAWRQVMQRIPGTRFNFDFWDRCIPRRSTYPACRAVLAARQMGAEEADDRMLRAIQEAYYLQARNPSDAATLIALAAETGLDPEAFAQHLGSARTEQLLQSELAQARALGLDSFPGLRLRTDERATWPVAVDYLDARVMLENIDLLRNN